jgi:predicted DNA-binding protein (UPF0251 family)
MMSRPSCCRKIGVLPTACRFVPDGVAHCDLEEVTLSVDEFEALRLADLEGLYQEEAAEKMGISRQTFGNIVAAARKKIAGALVNGKALTIGGGPVTVVGREFACRECGHAWTVACGEPRPDSCPNCGSTDIRRGERPILESPEPPRRGCGAKPGRCKPRSR